MSEDEKKTADEWLDKWQRRSQLINQIGWPTLIIIAIGFGIRASFFWAAPIVEMVAKKHVETLGVMEETQRQIAGSIEKQAENGREFVAISKQHRDSTDAMAKKLDEVHRVIVRPVKPGE